MKRSMWGAVAVVALLARAASGQDESPFRGVGIWYNDTGYLVAEAIANSINTDTLMRSNEYIYACYKNAVLERTEHIRARRRLVKETREATLKRLRENPEQRDVEQGDALNVIMMDLLNPKGSLSELRRISIELDVRTIQQIPFVFRGQGLSISLRRLHVSDGDWPTLLNDDAFRVERKRYTEAVEQALEENLRQGRLKPETILRVSKAVKEIRSRVQVVVEQKPDLRRFVAGASSFVAQLDKAASILDRKVATDVIADLDRFSGTTLAELLDFMRNYHLMFAPADSPEERKVYVMLFDQLSKQRQEYAKIRPELFRDDWILQPGADPGPKVPPAQ